MADSEHHRRFQIKFANNSIDGIKFLMWASIIAIAATFFMCFTGTKVYMSSASDIGITGLVKKAIYMVFMLSSTIPIFTSVVSLKDLIFEKRQALYYIPPLALLMVAYVSMLVTFILGVCLVLILYFI